MSIFPARKWEPTGVSEDGKTLWSSKELDSGDKLLRADYLKGFQERQQELENSRG